MVRRSASARRVIEAPEPDFSGRNPETTALIGRKSGSEMSVAYRRFDKEDAAACASILKANYCSLGAQRCGIFGRKAEARFEEFISEYSENRIIRIARDRNYRVLQLVGGALAGVVGVAGFMPRGRSAMVVDVSVDPAIHGEGIGSFLVSRLIEELRSLPLVRILALESSPNAVRLYERLGFRRTIMYQQNYEPADGPVFMKMYV
ncbi:MAG: GNAT family N-acetyltransferase [Candidatus Micrarchaeota archaeon]